MPADQDGAPNFVFRRSDSVYTPSYAIIDKVGGAGEAEYAIYSLALEDGQAEDAKDADEWRILLSWDGSG